MKKPLFYLLSTALVFSLTSEVNTTYAETVGTGESEASIEFTLPEDAVAPVNPRNPGEEYPGGEDQAREDGHVTGQTGPLTLDYASNISFGTDVISTSRQTYESVTASPFVQVSDRRTTGEGWLLTAGATSFTGTIEEDGTTTELGETLPGSSITFRGGVAESESTKDAPEVNQTIALSTDGETVNVANAEAKEVDGPYSTAEGLGTWAIGWLTEDPEANINDKIILEVPEAAASEGNHTASINWTLSDGPTEGPIDTTPVEEDNGDGTEG